MDTQRCYSSRNYGSYGSGTILCVRAQVRQVNALSEMEGHEKKWTLTDGFYANMGGYVLSIPKHKDVPVDTRQLILLAKGGYIALPRSSLQAIQDKSKADGIAKGLACLQASFLVFSTVARAIQHLAVTTLELSTVAYVFFSTVIFASLWCKPLDIRVPTTIQLLPGANIDSVLKSLLDRRVGGLGEEGNYASEYYFIPYRFNKHDSYADDRLLPRSFLIAPVFAVLYGIWHLLAWKFFFASPTEMYIWRVCTIVVTICLPLIFAAAALDEHQEKKWRSEVRKREDEREDLEKCEECGGSVEEVSDHSKRSDSLLFAAILIVLGTLYAAARIAMIVEALMALRMLPASAYETVQWTNFMPHL